MSSNTSQKINGKKTTFDDYGMYMVDAYSLWKTLLALTIVYTASIIFLIRWLVGHEGIGRICLRSALLPVRC